MNRLNWKDLFCEERVRNVKQGLTTEKKESIRNRFDEDYERIVYSSSVRRLQDKAQVFPLQRNDFTRTRLTHSIEVASLGRSMAWQIAEKLHINEERHFPNQDVVEFDSIVKMKRLPSIVETACLVHDLGNPPFGHYGEDIIKNWFTNFFDSNEKELSYEKLGNKNDQQALTELQKSDFTSFDGNAQTIHILCKLQFLNDEYGANFTLGTLAVLMKYPWNSSEWKENRKNDPKFGYMQSEEDIFKMIKMKTDIGPHRHPAVYIVEAADDIAYMTADLEDGVKNKLICWSQIEEAEILSEIQKICAEKEDKKTYKDLLENLKIAEKNQVPNLDLIRFQNIKIAIQGLFIRSAIYTFTSEYEDIMNGRFEEDLLKDPCLKVLIKKLKKLTNTTCFQSEEVVSLELVGDKVVNDLLNLFVPAILRVDDISKARSKDQKLIKLISSNFIHVHKAKKDISDLNDYERLQIVTDFISGMTDSYAVNLHKKLTNGMMKGL